MDTVVKGREESYYDLGLFQQARILGVRDLHWHCDADTGLYAIIAIHSTSRGPAMGGCRCLSYASGHAAAHDAMRLARGMSYKAAIADLPYGGGKAVLLRPDRIADRKAYFEAFGAFVESLGGEYITAEDSGTTVADMDSIRDKTTHVLGSSDGMGDPSPLTALGVRMGIQAALAFRDQREELQGSHIAIQGVGQVGYQLAAELHRQGARLSVADYDARATERCADEFGARIVAVDDIYAVPCDVFSPCALGGTINPYTIARLDTGIIAGSANNQLAGLRERELLLAKGIVYAPDYVINAGGLIHLTIGDSQQRQARIAAIHDTLTEIFQRAACSAQSTETIAETMAIEAITGPDIALEDAISCA